MLYELSNIIKSYNGRIVLDLPTASFQSRKIIGLLGPNGAGKTTLLEILAFLLPPSSGTIRFMRENVDSNSNIIYFLRQKVVLVQQKPILFSTTVFKNMEFPLKVRKMEKVERRRIIEDLLGLVGMEKFRGAKAHHLSGGETQRIAIAQALACFPEVILLDEPMASVDVENQIIIERIIREINRERRISVIFTTHDMIQASRMADEIVFLFEGKVTESIHENIFNGYIESDSSGRKYYILQDGLRIAVQTEKSGPARMVLNPGALGLKQIADPVTQDNCFKGRLVQMTDEKTRVRALIDIGIPISVLINKNDFHGLKLDLGEEVWLTCPPESIAFF